MLNQIQVMGRLVKDPELRYTQGGVPVCSFTLAVERDIKDPATGERNADFIDVVAWRGTAEMVSKYFAKGATMAVSGRLQFRTWIDNDGNNRKAAEIISERIYFAGSKRDKQAPTNAPEDDTRPQMEELEEDGDLPF